MYQLNIYGQFCKDCTDKLKGTIGRDDAVAVITPSKRPEALQPFKCWSCEKEPN